MTADRTLTGRLARDVDAAFPDLVRWVQDRLFSGLRAMTKSHADAEDAAQETLLRAYRALRGYERRRIAELDLNGWMWTIALNVVRNRARTASRRLLEVPLSPGRDNETPSAEDDADMSADEWRRRLDGLPDEQHAAVVLRHVVDLPYGAIATATGRPIGTVKSDVSRGIAALRRIMEQELATR